MRQSRLRRMVSSRKKRALIAVGVLCIIGAIVGVAFVVTQSKSSTTVSSATGSDGQTGAVTPSPQAPSISQPTEAPTPVNVPATNAPTPSPTEAVVTTTLDPTLSPTTIERVQNNILDVLKDNYPGGNTDVVEQPNTPQNKAWLWLSSSPNVMAYSDADKIQRYVLATLYFALNGEGWTRKLRWSTDSDECFWYGIICKTGRVSEISLGFNNMTGVLPPEVLMFKEHLTKLSFPSNNVNIVNFTQIMDLVNLEYLDLDNNIVGGSIPTHIGQLSNLKTLKLANTSLLGHLPDLLFDITSLEELSLSQNFFSGLPDVVGEKLLNLKVLKFDSNDAVSKDTSPRDFNLAPVTIPTTLGSLKELNIFSMKEHNPPTQGGIPSELGLLTAIKRLSLSNNKIEGDVPPEIYNLRDLSVLQLGNNQIIGTIPTNLQNLIKIDIFEINDNYFHGPLPTQLGTLVFLTQFIVHNNGFTGTIPGELSNPLLIHRISLSHNNLHGSMPEIFSRASYLQQLSLKNNTLLNGTVPESYGELSNLKIFEIENTAVTGSMPSNVCALATSDSRFTSSCAVSNFTCECCLGCFPPTAPPTFMPSRSPTVPPPPTTAQPSSMPSSAPTRNIAELKQFISTALPNRTHLLDDSQSPQFQAMRWLNNDPKFDVFSDSEKLQRYALVTFFIALNGDNWFTRTRWMEYFPECSWVEITCDSLNRVEVLNLYDNALQGTIPDEIILLKDSLKVLSLSENHITNSDLKFLTELTNLERIDFDNNLLVGTIPTEIGSLTKLWDLRMRSNLNLHGTLPTEIGTLSSLVQIQLSHNELTGTLPLAYMTNLFMLQKIKVHKNLLTGTLGSEISQLVSLQEFDIYFNDMNDTIPWDALSNLPDLHTLALGSNFFTGTISSHLGDLTNLEYLDISFNGLASSLPSEIGELTKLREIYTKANILSGFLPTELGNLDSLRRVDMEYNYVEGFVTEMGNLDKLEKLLLGANWFSKIIPTEWGDMTSLRELSLNINYVFGPLPTELGNLKNLQTFLLDRNDYLQGPIPSEIGALTLLQNFNVSLTALTGSMPTEICSLRDLALVDLEAGCGGNPEVMSCPCCTECRRSD